jgi:hypothetical protein
MRATAERVDDQTLHFHPFPNPCASPPARGREADDVNLGVAETLFIMNGLRVITRAVQADRDSPLPYSFATAKHCLY